MPTPNYTPLQNGQAPTFGTSGAGVAAYQTQLNQQNAGQAGYVPIAVDGFYGNLTQQAANFQPQSNVITPGSLQQQPTVNVPTGGLSSGGGVTQNVPGSYLSTLDLNANEQAAQNSQESLVAKMLANIQNQQGESAYKSELLAGSGLNTLKQDLQGLNSKILQKQAEINQSDIQLVNNMRNEERRDTLLPFAQMGQAKLAGDAAIMRALKTSEIGVLNAQAIGKQGDIALAKETIQEAVDAKYAPYREQNALYKAQLEAIQPFLDKAEKKQAAAQTFKLNQAMKEIDKAADLEKTINELATTAAGNGAPNSLISKISSAKTYREALTLAAKYTKDPLDRELKLAQIDKLRAENIEKIASTKGNTEVNKKIAYSAKALKAMTDKGIGTAAIGKSAIFGTQFIPGTEASNFKIQTDTLKSLLTLDNLKFLKGPTSDKDIAFLMAAGTTLNRSMTEIEFKNTLDDIYNTYSKYVPELQYADTVDTAYTSSQTSSNSGSYANEIVNG